MFGGSRDERSLHGRRRSPSSIAANPGRNLIGFNYEPESLQPENDGPGFIRRGHEKLHCGNHAGHHVAFALFVGVDGSTDCLGQVLFLQAYGIQITN